MVNISNNSDLNQLLDALGDQLSLRQHSAELVVIGGSGLLALGHIERATRDVDLVALGSDEGLKQARPLPPYLIESIAQVATDFRLPPDWLNSGPANLMDFGLPAGFEKRMVEESFGDSLTVQFASRIDQVHFKLYAAVDQGPGKHETDLRALDPTEDELLDAARWTMTHDPSEGYRMVLIQVLAALGVADATSKL